MTTLNKTVFITGASSGIGAALAREFASQGARLVLTARRTDKLEALAQDLRQTGAEVLTIPCNVTLEGDLEKAFARAREQFKSIDTVIANAGFGVAGRFEKLSLADYRRQFETNVFGLLRTAYAALPSLRESRGSLVLLGSVASYISLPNSSAYAMSKYSVRAFAEAIYEELRPQGITVTLLTPGFIESEIRRVDNQGRLQETEEDAVYPWLVVPTAKAAREMVRAILARKRERVITGHGKLFVFMAHCCPWAFRLLARMGTHGRSQPKTRN